MNMGPKNKKVNIPIDYYENIIMENLNVFIDLLSSFELTDSIITFLTSPDKTYNYKEIEYEETICKLKALKATNNNIFISFLGVPRNNDCIDNFGHSRLLRSIEDKRDTIYDVNKRQWYINVVNDEKEIAISKPYIAESGSYVISVLRKIRDSKGEVLGVLGLDVLFYSLAKIKNGDNIIVFMHDGTIIYNSHPKLKFIIEKQNNILYMISYEVFTQMFEESKGFVIDDFCGNKQNIEFCTLFDERFMLLKTEKSHLKVKQW